MPEKAHVTDCMHVPSQLLKNFRMLTKFKSELHYRRLLALQVTTGLRTIVALYPNGRVNKVQVPRRPIRINLNFESAFFKKIKFGDKYLLHKVDAINVHARQFQRHCRICSAKLFLLVEKFKQPCAMNDDGAIVLQP
jgi:hypothetical protein